MTIQPLTARRAASTTLLFLAIAAAHSAAAAPTASGKAFDMNVSVSLLGIPVLTVTPQEQVLFANLSIAFQDSNSAPSLADGNPATVELTTGELSAATQWIPGDSFLAVGSSASVVNLSLSAANLNTVVDPNVSLLAIGATQIQATAIVAGSCPPLAKSSGKAANGTNILNDGSASNADIVGDFVFQSEFEIQNLTPTNTTDIPGLQVTIDGTGILGIPANPLPNTSVDIGGVGTLLLNKQTVSGDGIASLSSVVDGLLLNVNLTVATIPLLQANVDISHSEASITCN